MVAHTTIVARFIYRVTRGPAFVEHAAHLVEIAAELHLDGRIRLCIQRVPGCGQRGPARQVLGMTGSVMAVALVVRGALNLLPAFGETGLLLIGGAGLVPGFLMVGAYGRK